MLLAKNGLWINKMKRIIGFIKQIIKPEEQHNYLLGYDLEWVKGCYTLCIQKEDYYFLNYFKKKLYQIKNRKKEYFWYVSIKKCSNKVGDFVVLKVEPYYKKTRMYLVGEDL